MQILLRSYKNPYEALNSVRSKVDEMPSYHGKVFSYTIINGRHVYLNKKERK